ncbi:MAG: APC family permease [Candidatus Tectimicrobiota bacterium]
MADDAHPVWSDDSGSYINFAPAEATSLLPKLKRLLLGTPLPTDRARHERLSKVIGLAVFSSDALSSVAYASEEILLILIAAGSLALAISWPIALAIVALLVIVATSYYQTIHSYPSGGGAYTVSRENLGVRAGLIAGAALMIDYVLTVSVSIAAGVAAITSAFPSLLPQRILLCLLAILMITLVNLRGVKESGSIFAVPTYAFVGSFYLMVITGLIEYLLYGAAEPTTPPHPASHELTWFLVLRAFASGCTALTGVEAISNGVQAFRPPESRNASITLIWMTAILGSLFVGITFLANHNHIVPQEGETVVSQLARNIFNEGILYYILQGATALILIMAANTSYADFPRLSSLLARDGYLPRQMINLGDRLVFSNGIFILGSLAALLIVLFGASTHALIPLYAVGVFLSFTLSQAGMVRHWLRDRPKGWQRGIAINSIGAVSTAAVLSVITTTKFTHGAWIVLVILPTVVFIFGRIHRHYRLVTAQITLRHFPAIQPISKHTVVVPVSGLYRQILPAWQYAKALSDDVRAIYIDLNPEATTTLRAAWEKWNPDVPLVILSSPYRSIVQPLLHYIEELQQEHPDQIVTVVLPEFVPAKWWQHVLHNQTALQIKGSLLFKRGVVVTSVTYHLRH